MTVTLNEIVKGTNAYYCLECGKCTGICPISKVFDDYSPRFNVEMALEVSEPRPD
jgi:heterodisulfide reductase subunit C